MEVVLDSQALCSKSGVVGIAVLNISHILVDADHLFVSCSYGKVFEGGMLERIARSYQAVQDNVAEEDAALANCNAAITRVESLQKKAENSTGEVQESIAEELLAQQVTMAQCIEQLETCEMSHAMLVSNLRDALHEQVC
jgi:hypothetical protein